MSTFKEKCDEVYTSIKDFRFENNEKLNMYKLSISKEDEVYSYTLDDSKSTSELRSISKLVTCLAIGIAIEKGIKLKNQTLALDMKIWPLLKEHVNLSNTKNLPLLENIELKHLLNHTMGFDKGLMFSDHIKNIDPDDLIDYVFNTDINHNPGEHFVYSNAGIFTFSVLIKENLGINLSEWVNEHLFQQINITNYQWTNYGKYCAGATGLSLSIEDLHKLGMVISDKGIYKGKRFISEQWIETIMTKTIDTPLSYDPTRVFPKEGYGYGIWISREGKVCYCDGTDGQYLIIIPDEKIVISTLGNQNNMKPITDCMKVFNEYIL
ncbi:MAG: serine hydrolase domain-containing protein [Clostridiaceae bacterium]